MVRMAANPIQSILPEPPEVSILTSAKPLPAEMRPFPEWKDGIRGRAVGCMTATSEPLWCPPADREVYEPDLTPFYEFYPLKTNLPHGCRGWVSDGDKDRWRLEAESGLQARIAYNVGRELWTGLKTGSASFQGNTTATSTTEALLPIAAIASALADYSECSQGQQAYIHVPSILVGHLSIHGYVERKGDKLMTIDGHVVVPGPGYPVSGPWGPYDQDARPPGPGEDGYDEGTYLADRADWYETAAVADPGQCWVYVTGVVEAAEPEYLKRTVGDDVEREERVSRMNEFYTTARAVTIARFDPCCVFAALAIIPGDA